PCLRDLQITLETLGYEDLEIRRAMRAVASGPDVPAEDDGDAWLRASLKWLSQSA
ncbi:Holliday junction branch migration protein RuvA, partial [Pseudomonas sp. HMWF031]